MDLQYAFEKLYSAMLVLVSSDDPLPKRVMNGWVCVGPLKIQRDDVPEHLQGALQALQEKLVAIGPGENGIKEDGPEPTATEAASIAAALFEFFTDVTLLLPPPLRE